MTATSIMDLTDEQSDFVDSIRDFCRRECGTAEQEEQRHLATAARRTGSMEQPVESYGA